MMKNKKGNLIGAMQTLPQAILLFVVFAIVTVVGFKFINGILGTMTVPGAGTSYFDNITYNNISFIAKEGLSQFTTQSSLIATIVVMSVILMIVIGAFSFKKI